MNEYVKVQECVNMCDTIITLQSLPEHVMLKCMLQYAVTVDVMFEYFNSNTLFCLLNLFS